MDARVARPFSESEVMIVVVTVEGGLVPVLLPMML